MADLTNPRLIWLKGWLFLGLGFVASLLLLLEAPSIRVAVLLAIAVWAFCRFYYFAFYVIQHDTDPDYRYAGLLDFLRQAAGSRSGSKSEETTHKRSR